LKEEKTLDQFVCYMHLVFFVPNNLSFCPLVPTFEYLLCMTNEMKLNEASSNVYIDIIKKNELFS